MRISVTVVLLVLLSGVCAQVQAETLFPAQAAPTLEVALHLPLAELKRQRRKDDAEAEAELHLADGTVLPLKVRPRGKSRLKECDYFPLWLDFPRKKVAGTVFAGQNKLKLVTHCADKYASRGYLAREYLIYKLLNQFTDVSFRVRALRVTYVDTGKNDWQRTHDAFLIEHKKQLAERVQGEVLEVPEVLTRDMAADYVSLVNLFQYFIANADFSLRKGPQGDECCHNAMPLQVGEDIFPVPYDFDVSGFVNPPYAVPQEALGISRMTQRKYRGYCRHNASLETARQRFLDEQASLFAMIDGFDELPGLRGDKLAKFLRPFFDDLADQRQYERKIIKRCRG